MIELGSSGIERVPEDFIRDLTLDVGEVRGGEVRSLEETDHATITLDSSRHSYFMCNLKFVKYTSFLHSTELSF